MENAAHPALKPLTPKEGLFVLHLFYHVDHAAWEAVSDEGHKAARHRLEALIAEAKGWPQVQIQTFGMIARADLGFMIVGPDLQILHALEKKITHALGYGVLVPVFTFFSLTEHSEYTTTDAEYAEDLKKEGLDPASPQFEGKMAAFSERMGKYTQDRLYPKVPDWEFFAFYPMNKRREGGDNWFLLDLAKRKELMKSHATVGRKYSGRILQIITGATGLDDWEWGVSLFAHDPFEVKAIVYEMRFDEVSARYGEFGDFYTGVTLPLAQALERVGLWTVSS